MAHGCTRPKSVMLEPELLFGHKGDQDGNFRMPREVAFSPDEKLIYVLDRTRRVQAFTRDGEFQTLWTTPPGQLGNPRGMDVAPDGTLYVADTHNNQIVVFTPEGKMVRRFGGYGKEPGRFIAVTDVTLDRSGNLWTVEYGAQVDRVQKLTPTGKPLLAFGEFAQGRGGEHPGRFSRPQGIVQGPDDHIYVADAVNHRIQVFTTEGKFVRTFGQVGSRPGELRYPYDVNFDRAGRLHVTEYGNCRVTLFTPEGKLLTCFGRPGRERGEFDHPWGCNIASDGTLYVSDTMNNRIQRFPALAV